jgi:heat shock protein HspQ
VNASGVDGIDMSRYQFIDAGVAWMASKAMPRESSAKFAIGQVVRHRRYPFRGVIYDVDPVFSNTEEWWLSIPEEVRPRKDQPFYHLFAENAETEYVAYVSEQNLVADTSGDPVRHPQVDETFIRANDGVYRVKADNRH